MKEDKVNVSISKEDDQEEKILVDKAELREMVKSIVSKKLNPVQEKRIHKITKRLLVKLQVKKILEWGIMPATLINGFRNLLTHWTNLLKLGKNLWLKAQHMITQSKNAITLSKPELAS
jgi:hypothetical protein